MPLIMLPHGGPFIRDESRTMTPWSSFWPIAAMRCSSPISGARRAMASEFVEQRLWAMGPRHAGRPRRRARLAGEERHGRSEARLHRRRILWRLCGAARAPAQPGTLSLRGQLSPGSTDLEAEKNRKLSATRYFREWRTNGQRSRRSDLKSVSPLIHGGAIQVPVLIAHGDKDQTVPAEQGAADGQGAGQASKRT